MSKFACRTLLVIVQEMQNTVEQESDNRRLHLILASTVAAMGTNKIIEGLERGNYTFTQHSECANQCRIGLNTNVTHIMTGGFSTQYLAFLRYSS